MGEFLFLGLVLGFVVEDRKLYVNFFFKIGEDGLNKDLKRFFIERGEVFLILNYGDVELNFRKFGKLIYVVIIYRKKM